MLPHTQTTTQRPLRLLVCSVDVDMTSNVKSTPSSYKVVTVPENETFEGFKGLVKSRLGLDARSGKFPRSFEAEMDGMTFVVDDQDSFEYMMEEARVSSRVRVTVLCMDIRGGKVVGEKRGRGEDGQGGEGPAGLVSKKVKVESSPSILQTIDKHSFGSQSSPELPSSALSSLTSRAAKASTQRKNVASKKAIVPARKRELSTQSQLDKKPAKRYWNEFGSMIDDKKQEDQVLNPSNPTINEAKEQPTTRRAKYQPQALLDVHVALQKNSANPHAISRQPSNLAASPHRNYPWQQNTTYSHPKYGTPIYDSDRNETASSISAYNPISPGTCPPSRDRPPSDIQDFHNQSYRGAVDHRDSQQTSPVLPNPFRDSQGGDIWRHPQPWLRSPVGNQPSPASSSLKRPACYEHHLESGYPSTDTEYRYKMSEEEASEWIHPLIPAQTNSMVAQRQPNLQQARSPNYEADGIETLYDISNRREGDITEGGASPPTLHTDERLTWMQTRYCVMWVSDAGSNKYDFSYEADHLRMRVAASNTFQPCWNNVLDEIYPRKEGQDGKARRVDRKLGLVLMLYMRISKRPADSSIYDANGDVGVLINMNGILPGSFKWNWDKKCLVLRFTTDPAVDCISRSTDPDAIQPRDPSQGSGQEHVQFNWNLLPENRADWDNWKIIKKLGDILADRKRSADVVINVSQSQLTQDVEKILHEFHSQAWVPMKELLSRCD